MIAMKQNLISVEFEMVKYYVYFGTSIKMIALISD